MDMGFFFTGIFVSAEARFTADGSPDGFNAAFACGTDSFKFKIPASIYQPVADAGLKLGDVCSFKCRFSTFNGRTYYRADSPITILS